MANRTTILNTHASQQLIKEGPEFHLETHLSPRIDLDFPLTSSLIQVTHNFLSAGTEDIVLFPLSVHCRGIPCFRVLLQNCSFPFKLSSALQIRIWSPMLCSILIATSALTGWSATSPVGLVNTWASVLCWAGMFPTVGINVQFSRMHYWVNDPFSNLEGHTSFTYYLPVLMLSVSAQVEWSI